MADTSKLADISTTLKTPHHDCSDCGNGPGASKFMQGARDEMKIIESETLGDITNTTIPKAWIMVKLNDRRFPIETLLKMGENLGQTALGYLDIGKFKEVAFSVPLLKTVAWMRARGVSDDTANSEDCKETVPIRQPSKTPKDIGDQAHAGFAKKARRQPIPPPHTLSAQYEQGFTHYPVRQPLNAPSSELMKAYGCSGRGSFGFAGYNPCRQPRQPPEADLVRQHSFAKHPISESVPAPDIDASADPKDYFLQHPTRQPNAPPESEEKSKKDGFQRFLAKHSSPTKARVTAGGRIVPFNPPCPPPLFNLQKLSDSGSVVELKVTSKGNVHRVRGRKPLDPYANQTFTSCTLVPHKATQYLVYRSGSSNGHGPAFKITTGDATKYCGENNSPPARANIHLTPQGQFVTAGPTKGQVLQVGTAGEQRAQHMTPASSLDALSANVKLEQTSVNPNNLPTEAISHNVDITQTYLRDPSLPIHPDLAAIMFANEEAQLRNALQLTEDNIQVVKAYIETVKLWIAHTEIRLKVLDSQHSYLDDKLDASQKQAFVETRKELVNKRRDLRDCLKDMEALHTAQVTASALPRQENENDEQNKKGSLLNQDYQPFRAVFPYTADHSQMVAMETQGNNAMLAQASTNLAASSGVPQQAKPHRLSRQASLFPMLHSNGPAILPLNSGSQTAQFVQPSHIAAHLPDHSLFSNLRRGDSQHKSASHNYMSSSQTHGQQPFTSGPHAMKFANLGNWQHTVGTSLNKIRDGGQKLDGRAPSWTPATAVVNKGSVDNKQPSQPTSTAHSEGRTSEFDNAIDVIEVLHENKPLIQNIINALDQPGIREVALNRRLTLVVDQKHEVVLSSPPSTAFLGIAPSSTNHTVHPLETGHHSTDDIQESMDSEEYVEAITQELDGGYNLIPPRRYNRNKDYMYVSDIQYTVKSNEQDPDCEDTETWVIVVPHYSEVKPDVKPPFQDIPLKVKSSVLAQDLHVNGYLGQIDGATDSLESMSSKMTSVSKAQKSTNQSSGRQLDKTTNGNAKGKSEGSRNKLPTDVPSQEEVGRFFDEIRGEEDEEIKKYKAEHPS